VQYIVRSVDHLLKTRFGIAEGLADTGKLQYEHITEQRKDGKPVVEKREAHRTLILDPATGTGTFLYSVISLIRTRFKAQKRAGMWSSYVSEHLLPRIFGFELLMAPYAVAHLKLGMQLAGLDLDENIRDKWAYDFSSEERLGVYLTNTLESVDRYVQEMLGPYRIISEEANAALRVKRELPILVFIGNPPYSDSIYEGEWIMQLLDAYRPETVERKSHVTREEWKFLRYAHDRIMHTGHGIIGFVINNSFIDATSLRGMRNSLISSFSEIYVLNLLGSVKGMDRDRYPDDSNVFDIEQGVAILLLVRSPHERTVEQQVFYLECGGTRDAKYEYLRENDLSTTSWKSITPHSPGYYLFDIDENIAEEYASYQAINEIMPLYSSGIQTKRDKLTVQYTRDELIEVVGRFMRLSTESARRTFGLAKDGDGWGIDRAREDLENLQDPVTNITPIMYRPFDLRFTIWTGTSSGFHGRPRREVMQHVVDRDNVCLLFNRQVSSTYVSQFLVCKVPCCHGTMYLGNRGQDYCAPVYRYQESQLEIEYWPEGENGRRPNLDPGFVNSLSDNIKLEFLSEGRGDLHSNYGPEDVLNYVYAIFNSLNYRDRYAEYLKLDFPRIPLTSDVNQFVRLCNLGQQVMALHLLESENLTGESVGFDIRGNNVVERGYPMYVPPGADIVKIGKAKLKSDEHLGRVYINPKQFFEGVEPEVWEFQIGGYQVAEKWLKDRRQRTLSHDDISHYTRIIEALRGTISLMEEIDKAIPEWPMS